MSHTEMMQKLNDYWKKNDIFQKSIDQRSDKLEAITYDWPPFASWTPHFGHWLVWVMKDIVWRYKTMKWYKTIRDWWWDCHGLPVEKAVESKLWLDWKKDIEEKIWIENFTKACRDYVSNVSDERNIFVDSIWRWADMENAYMTMNLDFMESVINVFDNLYSNNFVYKWFKVQRYCPSCATSLSNSEVNEWYEDRQDPAITIKFPVYNKDQNQINKYEVSDDGCVNVVCCAIKKDWKFLIWYHKKWQKYVFPGWKVEKWYSISDTVIKEIKEEIWADVVFQSRIWEFKEILKWNLWNLIYVDVEVEWELKVMEPDKITHFEWAEIIDSDNSLWMAVKIENTIIDDVDEIINQFYDLYAYNKKIAQWVNKDCPINLLAWTTTPWTLPSNSFLAVWPYIKYAMVFDKSSKEYYVLAQKLVSKYYKDESDYIMINVFQWEDMTGIFYKPLFEYINQSSISNEYKNKYFQIISGDYVSTEDWTGIVHIAPAFWIEDFDVVTEIFPREKAKDWLFLPVNDYGEFTDEVSDYKWILVYDANKDINKRLKDEWKLIFQQSYSHSYPHCWRCHTPLISKAMDSWFIKEPELKSKTLENAKKIWFVPDSVKKRFIDTLDSAPDRNLSRNRYWWSPIPIWQNESNPEDRISIWTLEELYQKTKTGSNNITKHIFVRHAESIWNRDSIKDSFGKLGLSDLWKNQLKDIKKNIKKELLDKEFVVVVSPLLRSFETAKPFLIENCWDTKIQEIENKYQEVVKFYHELFNSKKLLDYTLWDQQQLFEIWENVFVDIRLHELYHGSIDGQQYHEHFTTKMPTNQSISKEDETVDHMIERSRKYIKDVSDKFRSKTIISFSHWDPIVWQKAAFRKFNYLTQKKYFYPKNGELSIYYRDNDKSWEMDLHRPYVDNYRFNIDWNKYYRIPEVMDCWFESGSMPFGQVWYIKRKDGSVRSHKPLIYPADWIMEWLDQTRWWFRVMHVLWNAMMWKNSFDNVVINWMVLAEDGRKMSKSLKNYPDPNYLFAQYGTDAYRLYMLSSPSVKAEPTRFSEKWVDQIYKDFTASLTNAYKFFETYAKVDKFKANSNFIYFMRHSDSTWYWFDDELTPEWLEKLKTQYFVTKVLRLELDKIYVSPAKRTMQTANEIKKIYKEYLNKDLEIVEEERLWQEWNQKTIDLYWDVLKNEKNLKILLLSHDLNFEPLWEYLYWIKNNLSKAEIVKLPNYDVVNDLDKWILAELNQIGMQIEEELNNYHLDSATKFLIWFVDKLTNWYIRRSRRRFWASGMDVDKVSAYNTFFDVLNTFVRISAPFAPFISEDIYLKLKKYSDIEPQDWDSIHLKYFPVFSEKYVNLDLLQEIDLVRKIVSLWLFIRSKNNIKIKQPLSKMEIKID